jgi:Flp pilus assembly protein TadD
MTDDMAPEPDDLWHEADDLIDHGSFDKAIEIYRYILIRYGDNNLANEYANAHLGEILLMLGQTDLAENHIRKALNYDPQNPRYHSLLGFVYYTRYEWENAIQEYRLALDREPWNRLYLRVLGEAIFNSGDKKTGLEYLHKVAPLYPDNSGMLAELATAYMSIGDMASAREYAEEAVRTNPTDVMAHAVLRRIKQEIGKPPR